MRSKKLFWLLISGVISVLVGVVFHFAQQWRGASPKQTHFIGHRGWDLAVNEDGWLLAASQKELTAWRSGDDEPQQLFRFEARVPIKTVTAGHQGRHYVLDQDGGLLALDGTGRKIAEWPGSGDRIEAVSFRDGRLLAASQSSRLLWLDPVTLQIRSSKALDASLDVIDHVNGVVCGGAFVGDGLIHVWEKLDKWTAPVSRVGGLSISNDARWIAAVTWRGELYVIDREQREIRWRNKIGWTGEMRAVAFSPDSRRVVTCSPLIGMVWVFDCETGECILKSAVGGDAIDVVFVSSDEVVALHEDGDLRWWVVPQQKPAN